MLAYILLLEFPRGVSSHESDYTAKPCHVLRVSDTSTDADTVKEYGEAARKASGWPRWDMPHGLFPNRGGLKVELVFLPRGWRVLMEKRGTEGHVEARTRPSWISSAWTNGSSKSSF